MKLFKILHSFIFAGYIHSVSAASAAPICDWAPPGFDCNTPIECRDDWPHMSNNWEDPEKNKRKERRSIDVASILNSTRPIVALTHEEIADAVAQGIELPVHGGANFSSLSFSSNTSDSDSELQKRYNPCCRPTWECWKVAREAKYVYGKWGEHYKDLLDYRQIACCAIAYMTPRPGCDLPLRSHLVPLWWKEPPKCTSRDSDVKIKDD